MLRMRVANSTVVKFDERSDRRLVSMLLDAQERGTFIKYPKRITTANAEKETKK